MSFTAFTALCLYDFQSEDRSEISFRRGELLRIINFGATGWWCAEGHNKRGWVPAIYVQRVSDNLAEMLKMAKEEADADEAEEVNLNVHDAAPLLQEKMRHHGTIMRSRRATQYQRARPRYHTNSSIRAKRPYAPNAGTLESLVIRLTAFPLSKSLCIRSVVYILPSFDRVERRRTIPPPFTIIVPLIHRCRRTT
jgi:hypothetical protein